MTDKIVYKTISKEEYERLKAMSWETAQGELFYRTSAIRRYWRPAMAWLYFVVLALDFVIMPIVSIQLGREHKPITSEGGGLFFVGMSAIVGAFAYGRSLEKISQYRQDNWQNQNHYDPYSYQNDPYTNPSMPYPGSPPIQMAPSDKLNDALSNNEDEIIPPSAGTK